MPFTVSTNVTEREWDAFVGAHPDARSYHQWRWRHVFERAFGHRTEYCAVREGAQLAGILPLVVFKGWMSGRFAVSLPFVNYGGILAKDERAGRALLDHATALARAQGWSHVELRHRMRAFGDLPSKQHKVAMRLSLPPTADTAWNALDRKVRNQIRKAQKSGLCASVGGRELLDQFYGVFARNMRDLGTPVYPKQFFAETLDQFPDHTGIILIKCEGRVVAAGFTSVYRDTVEVPSAGSLREARSLCPNHLLYWTVIEQAIQRGLRVLDFGRSTPGEGTYNFKQQWGAQEEPLHWEYRLMTRETPPDRSPSNRTFAPAIAVWKRLPLKLATAIGPTIVRALP